MLLLFTFTFSHTKKKQSENNIWPQLALFGQSFCDVQSTEELSFFVHIWSLLGNNYIEQKTAGRDVIGQIWSGSCLLSAGKISQKYSKSGKILLRVQNLFFLKISKIFGKIL